jgi:dinuclear metal center YbgI/SA1388 family protein
MRIGELVTAMERVVPLSFAEQWDKVGLLVGNRERELSGPVLLTIDLTEGVIEEAARLKAGAIVAYHPPIFEPLARVTADTPRQRVILHAIERGVAVYSLHTALDAVQGGIADWLCEGLSGAPTTGQPGRVLGDCRALTPHRKQPTTQEVKIVTFVPAADVDKVRDALASVGAGLIGNYHACAFATEGEGMFLAGNGSSPRVGQAGRQERVVERRLEMVCSKKALPLATEMLRQFHPYEEPAIDIYELVPLPQRAVGSGRRLALDHPATVPELALRLKNFLKLDRVQYAIAGGVLPITRIGVVPGAGASLSRLAREEGCDVFVTGEMKHHDVLGALNSGMSVILGGHTATERGYLPRFKAILEKQILGASFAVSTADVEVLNNA